MSSILITNGTVIDGAGNPPVAASVLIRGNRIAAVGTQFNAERLEREGALRVIDAAGKTILPGFIDAHCHLSFGQTRTQEEQDLYTSVELRTLRCAWNAKLMLRAGVTGISQPGGSFYIGVGIREGIREGIIDGPRMTTAGRFITTSNGLSDHYPEAVGVPESSIATLANTKDEMLAEVRRQVKNGVDYIKLSDSPYGDYQAVTGDEMKAIADLAHQLKKGVTIHARGPGEMLAAAEAGFDWIMHGNVMTDEAIERLAQSNIPLVPTLLLLANLADFGHLVGTPVPVRDGCRRILDRTADALHRAHRAGVKFIVGTDSGFSVTPFGDWYARELELLMQYAGLSPLEAIQAGTKNAALVLGLAGEVGEIAPGKLADVIVVDGDPLADIRVLLDKRRITTVIKDGRVVEFDDEKLFVRPYDRASVFSLTDLTYDLVYGERAGATVGAPERREAAWFPEEGKTLASDLKERERAAAAAAAERHDLQS
ncbi:MAG: amidohydrolase family protein [Candidatus Binatia bacterium]